MLVAIFLCSENALSFDDKKKKNHNCIKRKHLLYMCDLSVQPEKYYRSNYKKKCVAYLCSK